MRLRWTTPAIEEFEAQIEYIFADDPVWARNVATSILQGLDQLLRFPGLGRKGKRPNTREYILSPFVIVYSVKEDAIELLRVYHGAQDR